MIKIISTGTCSLLLNSFFRRTSSTHWTWNLINRHFYSNFLVDVLAYNTNLLLPSVVIVCLRVDSPRSKVFNTNFVNEGLIAIVVHHLALGNRTFFAILIDEEIGGIHLGVLWPVHNRVWEVYFSWILDVLKETYAFTSALFFPCALISWTIFGIAARFLSDHDLVLNFTSCISTYNANLLFPTANEVSDNIDLVGLIKCNKFTYEWLFTILVH